MMNFPKIATAFALCASLLFGAADARNPRGFPLYAVADPTTFSWNAPTLNVDGSPVGSEIIGYIVAISPTNFSQAWPGDYAAVVPTLSTTTSENLAKLGLAPGMYSLQVAATTANGISIWSPNTPNIRITQTGALGGIAVDLEQAGAHNIYVGRLAGAAVDQETASGTYLQGFLEGTAVDTEAADGAYLQGFLEGSARDGDGASGTLTP